MAIEPREAVLEDEEKNRQPKLKQVKISTYGPAGENRKKFKRGFTRNPQNQILNDIPFEVIFTTVLRATKLN